MQFSAVAAHSSNALDLPLAIFTRHPTSMHHAQQFYLNRNSYLAKSKSSRTQRQNIITHYQMKRSARLVSGFNGDKQEKNNFCFFFWFTREISVQFTRTHTHTRAHSSPNNYQKALLHICFILVVVFTSLLLSYFSFYSFFFFFNSYLSFVFSNTNKEANVEERKLKKNAPCASTTKCRCCWCCFLFSCRRKPMKMINFVQFWFRKMAKSHRNIRSACNTHYYYRRSLVMNLANTSTHSHSHPQTIRTHTLTWPQIHKTLTRTLAHKHTDDTLTHSRRVFWLI